MVSEIASTIFSESSSPIRSELASAERTMSLTVLINGPDPSSSPFISSMISSAAVRCLLYDSQSDDATGLKRPNSALAHSKGSLGSFFFDRF